MNCPYCGEEAVKGKAAFSSLQAFVRMMVSYTSDEDKNKGFFKRNTKDRFITSGDEMDAWYCPACGKVIVSFDAE